MKKTTYILASGTFAPHLADGMLLKEFARFDARAAGLDCADTPYQPTESHDGGIFIRDDVEFDPYELAKTLYSLRKDNVVLCCKNGAPLGYVLDKENAQDITVLPDRLPRILVRRAKPITMYNCTDVFWHRQYDLRYRLAENGVFLESDEITLSPLYDIAPNTFIGRASVLTGSGKIGQGCTILDSRLHNASLGENVRVSRSVLTDCTVSDGTTVGPFAFLRPHTAIGKNVRIGDFVEIKNARIGDGTKVSHLTYVGDSTVGEGVNFGCGTVTTNYDGKNKHHTTIDEGAFIGCNVNLIAPVHVGENAYIAAGSTVTDDVPAHSLAIARSRQTVKENWVQKNMPDRRK